MEDQATNSRPSPRVRLTTAIVINGLCAIPGVVWLFEFWWVPVSGLLAGLIELPTRDWLASDRLGTARGLSVIVKFLFALIGFYALITQLASIALVVYWIVG